MRSRNSPEILPPSRQTHVPSLVPTEIPLHPPNMSHTLERDKYKPYSSTASQTMFHSLVIYTRHRQPRDRIQCQSPGVISRIGRDNSPSWKIRSSYKQPNPTKLRQIDSPSRRYTPTRHRYNLRRRTIPPKRNKQKHHSIHRHSSGRFRRHFRRSILTTRTPNHENTDFQQRSIRIRGRSR